MKFDEVSELFSEETLTTMKMMNTVGGETSTRGMKMVCPTYEKDCGNSKTVCLNFLAKCKCDTTTEPPKEGETTPPPFVDSPIDPGVTLPPTLPTPPTGYYA